MRGIIKWWNKEKGYGFIEYSDNQNIFVHQDCEEQKIHQLGDNQEISFTVKEKVNGMYLYVEDDV